MRKLAGFGDDDGFSSDLVPGLRSGDDAGRLASELAFATARLRELEQDPPGVYGEVATAGDPVAAAQLCFLLAYLSPLEDAEDPFAAVRAARDGAPLDGLPRGPRGVAHPGTPAAWERFGGGDLLGALRGDPSWEGPRRFERLFERLALPGLARAPRYELLVLLGRLGVLDVRPWSLELSAAAPDDVVLVSAKRVFGFGELLEVTRRVRALSEATGVPVAAFDLGLRNFGGPGARIRAGATVEGDAEVEAAVRGALGL